MFLERSRRVLSIGIFYIYTCFGDFCHGIPLQKTPKSMIFGDFCKGIPLPKTTKSIIFVDFCKGIPLPKNPKSMIFGDSCKGIPLPPPPPPPKRTHPARSIILLPGSQPDGHEYYTSGRGKYKYNTWLPRIILIQVSYNPW